MLTPHSVIFAREDSIQIGCGADQRQMCECLWEVAEVLPARTDLLRVKPQMVCVSQEFLKQQLSPFQLTSARQALDVPKRTCSEAALPARKPIDMRAFCLIAMDKSIFD